MSVACWESISQKGSVGTGEDANVSIQAIVHFMFAVHTDLHLM